MNTQSPSAPADFIPPKKLVIASRESPLAMWQALHIQSRLQALYPTTTVDILGMTTTGDQILDTPLALVGGKGLFVKELETALADGRADLRGETCGVDERQPLGRA